MRYVFRRFSEAFEILIHPERFLRLDRELRQNLQDVVLECRVDRWTAMNNPEQISPRKIAMDMIQYGMEHQWASEANVRSWEDLTPKEQHVAALVCLGYTNKEIAKKLVIATSTVKTHVRHILHKFELNGKLELKGVLRGWDFSAWEDVEVK
jgi:DNA-binding NarL/FixJ family response regulator